MNDSFDDLFKDPNFMMPPGHIPDDESGNKFWKPTKFFIYMYF